MQVMEAPPGTWTVVVDLTDPLNVEGQPVTFRSLDTAAAELQLRAFRAAAVERTGRAGLRIRVEIDAPSPRHASDRLWQVIEKVFLPGVGGPSVRQYQRSHGGHAGRDDGYRTRCGS